MCTYEWIAAGWYAVRKATYVEIKDMNCNHEVSDNVEARSHMRILVVFLNRIILRFIVRAGYVKTALCYTTINVNHQATA